MILITRALRRHARYSDKSNGRDLAALRILSGLEKEYRELDTHYAWVLAGDWEQVEKAMTLWEDEARGKLETEVKDADHRANLMKRAFETYEKLRKELHEAVRIVDRELYS